MKLEYINIQGDQEKKLMSAKTSLSGLSLLWKCRVMNTVIENCH